MELIRRVLVLSISTIIFITLFLGNLFLTFSWSLEYETIEPRLQKMTEKIIENINKDKKQL